MRIEYIFGIMVGVWYTVSISFQIQVWRKLLDIENMLSKKYFRKIERGNWELKERLGNREKPPFKERLKEWLREV